MGLLDDAKADVLALYDRLAARFPQHIEQRPGESNPENIMLWVKFRHGWVKRFETNDPEVGRGVTVCPSMRDGSWNNGLIDWLRDHRADLSLPGERTTWVLRAYDLVTQALHHEWGSELALQSSDTPRSIR